MRDPDRQAFGYRGPGLDPAPSCFVANMSEDRDSVSAFLGVFVADISMHVPEVLRCSWASAL